MSDICASVLLTSGWLKPGDLAALPREQWRTTLIDAMAQRGVGDSRALRSKLNSELALSATIYMHLRDAGIPPRELGVMNAAARREALLGEIHDRRGTPVDAMRDCDEARLHAIAESGLLRQRLEPLIEGVENVAGGTPVVYGLTDEAGHAMDTLKILPLASGDFLGIYHVWIEDAFRLLLARSSDLVSWTPIAELGDHNHQGDIKPMGEGYVVANEQDIPDRGNHLRFRHYESLDKLISGESLYDKSLPRELSRYSEGTPDIRLIEGDDPGECSISIGFHYYRRTGLVRKVDRLAQGVLAGFDRWIAWIDELTNQSIVNMGYKGNIGGRCSFSADRETWYIQEAQLRWKDWSSWRVLLGNGRSYIQLEPRTRGASESFANPSLARWNGDRYAASLFLPRQGSVPGEAGELVFGFQAAG
jgi:hypothetical protein